LIAGEIHITDVTPSRLLVFFIATNIKYKILIFKKGLTVKSDRKYYFFIALLLLLLAASFSCQKEQKEKVSREVPSGEKSASGSMADLLASMSMYHFSEPVEAPDFELQSVQGGRVNLTQFRGKVVMLSFWATW
jgi:hypothetical protein